VEISELSFFLLYAKYNPTHILTLWKCLWSTACTVYNAKSREKCWHF